MKTMKLILIYSCIAGLKLHAMTTPELHHFAQQCYESGINDANQATMSRVLEIANNAHAIKIRANNLIITHKFHARCVQDQLDISNNSLEQLTHQKRIEKNIREALSNKLAQQDIDIATLTNQRDATLCKIDRMKNAQHYTLGSTAMIALIDPFEKQYLIDSTDLSNEEIDSKMIGERLFILSAIALCHPVSAAIVATSAAAIKAKHFFKTSNSQ